MGLNGDCNFYGCFGVLEELDETTWDVTCRFVGVDHKGSAAEEAAFAGDHVSGVFPGQARITSSGYCDCLIIDLEC